MGNHIAVLDNYEYVAELIATILKIQNGVDKFDAIREIKKPEAQRAIRKALQYFKPYDEEPCKVHKEQEGAIEFI